MPPNDAKSGRKSMAIIGLGSIGGVVAGLLSATGRYDIVACVRRPIEKLTVERAEGAVEVPIMALTDAAHARPVDWVLLCTKAQDTAASAHGCSICAARARESRACRTASDMSIACGHSSEASPSWRPS